MDFYTPATNNKLQNVIFIKENIYNSNKNIMYLEIKSTETSKRKTMKDIIKHYKTLKNINGKLNKWHYIPSS